MRGMSRVGMHIFLARVGRQDGVRNVWRHLALWWWRNRVKCAQVKSSLKKKMLGRVWDPSCKISRSSKVAYKNHLLQHGV